MEKQNLGLINYQQDDFSYQDDSSMYEESVEEEDEDDDAMTQSAETGDKTDQEISTHELKYDDSESFQFEGVIEGDEICGKAEAIDENSNENDDDDEEGSKKIVFLTQIFCLMKQSHFVLVADFE